MRNESRETDREKRGKRKETSSSSPSWLYGVWYQEQCINQKVTPLSTSSLPSYKSLTSLASSSCFTVTQGLSSPSLFPPSFVLPLLHQLTHYISYHQSSTMSYETNLSDTPLAQPNDPLQQVSSSAPQEPSRVVSAEVYFISSLCFSLCYSYIHIFTYISIYLFFYLFSLFSMKCSKQRELVE